MGDLSAAAPRLAMICYGLLGFMSLIESGRLVFIPALGSVGSRRSPPPGDTVGAGTGGAGGCGFSAQPAAAAKAATRIAVEVKRFMHT